VGFFGLVGLGLGLVLILGPLGIYAAAARTVYAITNRRALVRQGYAIFGGQTDNYSPLQLHAMVRHDSWMVRGAGDLVFRTRTEITVTNHGRGGTSVSQRVIRFGFLGIDNAGKVERILRETLIDRLVDRFVN
jgi:hypothetical protein